MKETFVIERKTFGVERVRDWVFVEERGRGWIAKLELTLDAAKWLLGKLKSLQRLSSIEKL